MKRQSIIKPNFVYFQISKHKNFEYELISNKENNIDIFNFQIKIDKNIDHAGFRFRLSLFKLFEININIYDSRHWDHEKKLLARL